MTADDGFVTVPHKMNKIYILIVLLPQLFYTLVYGQESPCPQYFTYIIKPGTDETIGRIEIQSPPRINKLHLKVTFQMAAELPTGYLGRLELARSTEESAEAVRQGRNLLYYLYFPLRHPIPKIIGIWFNGEQYCSGPNITGNFISTITRQHTLFLPNELLQNDQPDNLSHHNTRATLRTTLRPISMPNPTPISRPNPMPISKPNPMPISKPNPTPISKLNPRPIWSDSQGGNPMWRPISKPNPRPIWRPTSKPNPRLISKPTSAKPASQDDDDGDSINNNRECGINSFPNGPNLLIINGYTTSLGQWPWLVALFAKKEDKYNCAGSVLTNKHIITAAHCVISSFPGNDIIYRAPNELLVSLGIFKLTELHKTGNVNREVANYEVHPDYTHTDSGDADLAILVLGTSVDYSPVIKPICLWTGSISLDNVVNKNGLVVGWGVDEHGNFTADPRLISVPIVSQEVCLRSHPSFFWLTSERTFCAGERDGSGPCNGDSGGGLVISIQDRYHLRGVVSRSIFKNVGEKLECDLNQYVVYLDVAKYLPWIREQISIT